MIASLLEAPMPVPRLGCSILLALALASPCWSADARPQKPSSARSVAPHQRVSRHVYGAPIQSPIVGRKAPKYKTAAKSSAIGKVRHSQKPHSDLDDPF